MRMVFLLLFLFRIHNSNDMCQNCGPTKIVSVYETGLTSTQNRKAISLKDKVFSVLN
jgi:hypothetical protein